MERRIGLQRKRTPPVDSESHGRPLGHHLFYVPILLLDCSLGGVARVVSNVETMERLLAGPGLFLAGSQPDLLSESLGH